MATTGTTRKSRAYAVGSKSDESVGKRSTSLRRAKLMEEEPDVNENQTDTLGKTSSDSEFLDVMLDPPVKSRFTSSNFLKASQIIRSIRKTGSKSESRPVFWSDEERILTYELTVAILKYSSFLREALEKSHFFAKYPFFQETGQEELLVILYDLMERDFRTSAEDSPLPEAFSKLQNAILSNKTKLMAHIAKLRIKHDATALESMLPTNLRQRQNIDKNPLYIWLNLKKTGLAQIITVLKMEGLKETAFEDDTLIQENYFSVSRLHPELIRMHSSKHVTISNMPIFHEGSVVIQDKSACLPVYVLAKALFYREAINHRGSGMENLNPFPKEIPVPALPPSGASSVDGSSNSVEDEPWYNNIHETPVGKMLPKPESVIVTHCGSGRSAAHLAILLSEAVPRYLSKSVNMSTTGTNLEKAIKSKFVQRPALSVLVFGVPPNKYEEINKYLKKTLGVTNIRLFTEDFINISGKDPRLKGCIAIFVNPPSSGSALKDPVSYICSEGGDEQILHQYSRFVTSSVAEEVKGPAKSALIPIQTGALRHALFLQNIKLILYTTCSNLECENGEVVKSCLNDARRHEETRKCQVFASIVMQSLSKQHREVSYEVVSLAPLMQGYEDADQTCFSGEFVDMQPSSACSGVFMALIRRRDRMINMAKNPVKQFVATHIKQWTPDDALQAEEDFGKFLSKQMLSQRPSAGTSNKSFTEDELARYLARKLNIAVGKGATEAQVDFTNTPSIVPVFVAQMKKRVSKKAIVKRVSTPTHSSLQRQTEKYSVIPLVQAQVSSPVTTPRAGTPQRSMSAAGVDAESVASSAKSGKGTGPIKCPFHAHGQCVCARCAKRHPELMNQNQRVNQHH